MKIENMQSVEAVVAYYEKLDAVDMLAQQIGLRAAVHALESLCSEGVSEANAKTMLDNCNNLLFRLHEVAHARGIQLAGYR